MELFERYDYYNNINYSYRDVDRLRPVQEVGTTKLCIKVQQK